MILVWSGGHVKVHVPASLSHLTLRITKPQRPSLESMLRAAQRTSASWTHIFHISHAFSFLQSTRHHGGVVFFVSFLHSLFFFFLTA